MDDFYKLISHTADLGVQLTCKTLSGLYMNSAKALMDLIAGIENIHPLNECEIAVEGIDPNDLLIRWLNELIYIFAAEKKLFSGFEIVDLTDTKLQCKAKGEFFNPERHVIRKDIKAATYHNVNIEKIDGWFKVTIIFDV